MRKFKHLNQSQQLLFKIFLKTSPNPNVQNLSLVGYPYNKFLSERAYLSKLLKPSKFLLRGGNSAKAEKLVTASWLEVLEAYKKTKNLKTLKLREFLPKFIKAFNLSLVPITFTNCFIKKRLRSVPIVTFPGDEVRRGWRIIGKVCKNKRGRAPKAIASEMIAIIQNNPNSALLKDRLNTLTKADKNKVFIKLAKWQSLFSYRNPIKKFFKKKINIPARLVKISKLIDEEKYNKIKIFPLLPPLIKYQVKKLRVYRHRLNNKLNEPGFRRLYYRLKYLKKQIKKHPKWKVLLLRHLNTIYNHFNYKPINFKF